MLTENHYHNGLLLLAYLIMAADGILDEKEQKALKILAEHEEISLGHLENFIKYARALPERSVYNQGLDELDQCTFDQKLRAFSWLYRIAEVDGELHVKEVRFLLYSLRQAGLELDEVIRAKEKFPSLLHNL
jgi:uncharacterized tellurite resistance protein B-like protein